MDERRLSVERSTRLRDNPTFWSTSVGCSVMGVVQSPRSELIEFLAKGRVASVVPTKSP